MAIAKKKRKSKPWQATVWVSNVRVASECFATRTEACIWHDKTKVSFETGMGPIREMTLGEVVQRYREMELPSKMVATRRSRETRLRVLEEAPVAGVMMKDFDGHTVDQFVAWLLKDERAKTASRKSFAGELKTLKLVLGHYRDYGDAQYVVPVTKRHLKAAMFKGPIPRKGRDFYLPVDHALRWFAALAKQKNPVYADLGRLQVITGMRIGEACALCDDAIDWDRQVLVVKRTMEWTNEDGTRARRIVERTKTRESRRELPLPAELIAILRGALARQPTVLYRTAEGTMARVLFHGEAGQHICRGVVAKAYGRAFKKAGLPWSGTHICRDTNGTLGLKDSSLEAVRVNHGHSSVVQTEGYARIHAMVENTVPEKVARQLFGGESKTRIQNRIQSKAESKK